MNNDTMNNTVELKKRAFSRLRQSLGSSVISLIAVALVVNILPFDHPGDYLGLLGTLVVLAMTVGLWRSYYALDRAVTAR